MHSNSRLDSQPGGRAEISLLAISALPAPLANSSIVDMLIVLIVYCQTAGANKMKQQNNSYTWGPIKRLLLLKVAISPAKKSFNNILIQSNHN